MRLNIFYGQRHSEINLHVLNSGADERSHLRNLVDVLCLEIEQRRHVDDVFIKTVHMCVSRLTDFSRIFTRVLRLRGIFSFLRFPDRDKKLSLLRVLFI